MSFRHRALAGAVFLALFATALPSHAQGQPGARCPADTPAADFTPQFANNTLRCQRRALAPTFCPVTHPVYDVNNGPDLCRLNPNVPVAIGVAPTYAVQCPPSMSPLNDGGPGNRDVCRGNNTDLVMPLLGNY